MVGGQKVDPIVTTVADAFKCPDAPSDAAKNADKKTKAATKAKQAEAADCRAGFQKAAAACKSIIEGQGNPATAAGVKTCVNKYRKGDSVNKNPLVTGKGKGAITPGQFAAISKAEETQEPRNQDPIEYTPPTSAERDALKGKKKLNRPFMISMCPKGSECEKLFKRVRSAIYRLHGSDEAKKLAALKKYIEVPNPVFGSSDEVYQEAGISKPQYDVMEEAKAYGTIKGKPLAQADASDDEEAPAKPAKSAKAKKAPKAEDAEDADDDDKPAKAAKGKKAAKAEDAEDAEDAEKTDDEEAPAKAGKAKKKGVPSRFKPEMCGDNAECVAIFGMINLACEELGETGAEVREFRKTRLESTPAFKSDEEVQNDPVYKRANELLLKEFGRDKNKAPAFYISYAKLKLMREVQEAPDDAKTWDGDPVSGEGSGKLMISKKRGSYIMGSATLNLMYGKSWSTDNPGGESQPHGPLGFAGQLRIYPFAGSRKSNSAPWEMGLALAGGYNIVMGAARSGGGTTSWGGYGYVDVGLSNSYQFNALTTGYLDLVYRYSRGTLLDHQNTFKSGTDFHAAVIKAAVCRYSESKTWFGGCIEAFIGVPVTGQRSTEFGGNAAMLGVIGGLGFSMAFKDPGDVSRVSK
jgi:hypothetical protein